MSVWTVANQKGGVGKTTTAVTLAGIAAERGESCLLIDLDPQGSATHYLRGGEAGGAEALFVDGGEPAPQPCSAEGVALLGASARLAALERSQGSKPGMGRILSARLAPLGARYDRIIIDTPPMLGMLLINALTAADALITPVQTDPLALHGLEGLMRTLEMMRKAGSRVPEPVILPTMMDKRVRVAHETLARLQAQWGERVFDAVVPLDTRIREAARDGEPLNRATPYRHAVVTLEKLFDRLAAPEATAA